VGKTDAYGNSALLLAAERGHQHLIQLLIGQAHTKFYPIGRKITKNPNPTTRCVLLSKYLYFYLE
jgi:hypothetical protein